MRFWRWSFFISGFAVLIILAVLWRREWQAVLATAPTAWTDDVHADCAVALTGGSGRLREALDLLYRGAVKKLIVSGVHPKVQWRELVPQVPLLGDLKEEDVVLEKRSTTTYGNAVQTLPLVEALHCHSLVVVTSTLHMSRALRTFRSVFPSDFHLQPYAVVSGSLRASWMDLLEESGKSLFYSVWAY